MPPFSARGVMVNASGLYPEKSQFESERAYQSDEYRF